MYNSEKRASGDSLHGSSSNVGLVFPRPKLTRSDFGFPESFQAFAFSGCDKSSIEFQWIRNISPPILERLRL
jgi:hypothetical protein